MKCPKCGNDYEGSKCPYCGGLDIVVNDSDYQRRKKAYEELNSKQESVGEKPKKEKKAKPPKEKKKKEPAELQKRRKVAIGVSVGMLFVCCIILVGYFSVRKMVSIYFKIGEDIYKDDYNVKAHQEVCDAEIWNADRSRLFTTVIPADINDKTIVDKMASMNGDYLGAVTYDEVQKYYTIWVWNEKGDKVERMVTSGNQLEIVYVADDSSVIYRNNEMVGDGTLVGNTLNRIDNSKNINVINENVSKEFIFLRDKSIVYVTDEGNLYVSYFNNVRESTLISANVNSILGELKNCEDRYSQSSAVVHDTHMTAQLVYISNGDVYYCNLNRIKDKKRLFETEKTGIDVVYQENAEYAYSINRMSVDGISIIGDSYETTPLAKQKAGTEVVYLTGQETVAYITDTGKFISIKYKKGNFVKTILDGVADGKDVLESGKTTGLYHADGNEGLLVINNGKFYFFSNLLEEPIRLEASECKSIRYISYYGKKIYIVDDSKTMYIFNSKGKLEDIVKDTEFIWVG